MKKVFVDNLKMQNGDLVCKDKSGFYKKIFLKQGSLDGACATYSVIMNLLIIRAISEKDTWINAEHKTRETKKLFKVFCNDYGMHRNGQTYYKITKMLKESFSSIVTPEHKVTKNEESEEIIMQTLDEKIPIIISVSDNSDDWAHAMLAVGYEANDKGKMNKILCLDPSGDYIHGRKRWNTEIQITPKQYRLSSVWEGRKVSNKKVYLDDVIIITKN